MSTIVSLILSLVAALPQDLAAIQTAYANIRASLSATDQAQIDGVLAALNTKTDADVAQLDTDAQAAGAT